MNIPLGEYATLGKPAFGRYFGGNKLLKQLNCHDPGCTLQLKHIAHQQSLHSQKTWGDRELVSEESTRAGDLLQQCPDLPGDLPLGPL